MGRPFLGFCRETLLPLHDAHLSFLLARQQLSSHPQLVLAARTTSRAELKARTEHLGAQQEARTRKLVRTRDTLRV
jgi:hypothetical protein